MVVWHLVDRRSKECCGKLTILILWPYVASIIVAGGPMEHQALVYSFLYPPFSLSNE
jgi:hypothetical protein